MDTLEEFEKPIMQELFEKCPDLDSIEKVKSLNLSPAYTSRGGSHVSRDALKDVWVGSIQVPIPGKSRMTQQPVVWLKFHEDKLDVGVVSTPAETYEYANPNKFNIDTIAEIVNKITKTYRAHRR
jgi:hypothetical protein